MKNFGPKFALIGLLTALGLGSLWPPGDRLKLGIDLSGGTILVYQVQPGALQNRDFQMDDLIAALKRRVNPEGVLDIPIRKVGRDRVEIILPEASAEQVERVKRQMTAVGAMAFRILADRRDPRDASPINRALAARPGESAPPRYSWATLAETFRSDLPAGGDAAAWARLEGNELIHPGQQWDRDRFTGARVTLVPAEGSGGEEVTVRIVSNTSDTLRLDPTRADVFLGGRVRVRDIGALGAKVPELAGYRVVSNPSQIPVEDPNLAVRAETLPNGVVRHLVLYKQPDRRMDVTGDFLSNVYPTEDEQVQLAVGFSFNPTGARRFRTLTEEHTPETTGRDFLYHLAILLDDFVMSAPVIEQAIGESGIIRGMPPEKVDELITILRAGSLPASIDPVPLQQEQIGPTLGRDTIEKGVRAIGISMLVVPIFMIAYYRFAGVVAVIALILNMILLIGSMAFTGSSFTLPGLAGLALTIGMAVDANVLIFERMREEKDRGANLGTQIRNGFGRAWSTILDSNVTTILSGMVLWAIGTEEVKGFALTLIIGLVWNLFTAVFVSRVIFDFFYAKGWLKSLSFAKILGKTNINFVGPRRPLQIASVILILVGLAAFAAQRGGNFNIDFTGGTLVTVQLDPSFERIKGLSEGQRAAFVRSEAGAAGLRDVSVESLNVEGEARGTRFNIRTTEADARKVQDSIQTHFGDALARLNVEVGPPTPIAAPAAAEGAPAALADRFAGGRAYNLRLTRDVDPAPVAAALETILREQGVVAPETRFEVVHPRPGTGATAASHELVVRTSLDEASMGQALQSLRSRLPADPNLLFERLENFGAAVARDTQVLAITAILGSWAVIIGYLWFRFKSVTYGLAAVLALVHDVLLTLGFVAISPYKIDLPMVAAFLTLIGFSVNDTIVIFDRIREIKGKSPHVDANLVNAALNQTLSRTILTSLTAWLVVLILYLFGGEGLQGFSFCLVVGFLSGTYSTIYIAAPVLIDWARKPAAKPRASDL